MPAPEKPADAEKRKRVRDAAESDSEPLAKTVAKRVKVTVQRKDRRGERRAPVIQGATRNKQVCAFCKGRGYECWRQGGPHPRGSCYECASHKQKCGNTDLNWADMQHEKTMEKLERRQTAKGRKVERPLSTKSVEPATSTMPAPKTTTSMAPAQAPVAGPSKPKVHKSHAVVSTSDDESDVPPKDKGKGKGKSKGKGKAVLKSAPIVLTSGSEYTPASAGKGTFQGM